jgi:hypothetical protein
MFVLDAAVVAGVLLLLTKVGDLLLRPHQQRTLQTWLEAATLRLSYSSMIAMTRYLAMRRIWVIVIVLALLVPVQLSVVAPSVAVALQSTTGATLEQIQMVIGILLVALVIATIPAAFALRWVVREQSVRRTLLRFATLVIFLFVVTLTSGALMRLADMRLPNPLLSQMIGAVMLVSGTLFTALFIVAWLFAFALALHVLLRLIEAIAWRVVEYQRGAWAAVVALATAILGALDLYLKR